MLALTVIAQRKGTMKSLFAKQILSNTKPNSVKHFQNSATAIMGRSAGSHTATMNSSKYPKI